ncbi:MAG: hypothetical protein DCE90_18755 [Pseudanabaena sp.]|nr:MAG: hypothetical protein DCE90_18755 [Pseudanabaena sp.]
MNFQTEEQEVTYSKVASWLPEICDQVSNPFEDKPVFSLQFGSAAAIVEVRPFRQAESVIYIWSYVATEVTIKEDLLHFLLKQNDTFRFGGFSMADEGDIRFHVTLLGACCQKNEFELAIKEVLESADKFDDVIVETWGGRRSTDDLFA